MLAAAGDALRDKAWIYDDIHRAAGSTAAAEFAPLDHLCCGNLGRVEFLLTAAGQLAEPAWNEKAIELGSAVVQKARQSGHYGMGTNSVLFLSSFHQGMAGIGYQMLRLARPDRFPAVLLWE
jgi:lantibiotic modifying enzyme